MKFYRFDIRIGYNDKPYINMITYDLIKETPKGYWIGRYGNKEKWIPIISRKRFAYSNMDEALFNLIKRTEKRIIILSKQLSKSNYGLNLAKNFVIE